MIPARTPGAVLAEVHRRARQYRRRRAGVVAAAAAVLLLVVIVAVRLISGGDDDGEEAGGPVAPPALDVEVVDADDTGLPGGFVPRAVAAGPDGFVLTGAAPGGGEPVWRSGDGTEWEPASSETFAATNPAGLAATTERYLVAVTDAAGASPRILSSPDGQEWTALDRQPVPGEDLASLRAAGDRFYLSGSTGLSSSTDGATWEGTTTEGAPLPAGAVVASVGEGWVAYAVGADGVVAAAWSSVDGLVFTAATAPNVAPAGSTGGADRLVLARAGAPAPGCLATSLPPTTAPPAPATTAAPASAGCDYPIGFVTFDPVTGVTTGNPQPAFTATRPAVAMGQQGDGWVSVQQAPGGAVVWSSGDGLTWSRASDETLSATVEGPVVLAGADERTVVISDTEGTDRPPGVAVVTTG